MTISRRKVLITGAAGGMGRACARLFGLADDLILTDVVAPALEAFAKDLAAEGFTIAGTVAGDTCDEGVLAQLAALVSGGEPFAVIHTAGLSPSLADWRAIMQVNLYGTARLMQVLEPHVVPGTVAVLLASCAGHSVPGIPEIDAVMAAALEPDLVGRMTPFIDGMAPMAGPAGAEGISYSFSKRGVMNLCERKAADWGPLGGRVVTISPGLMLTPMGRREVEQTEGAATVMNAAPVGRPGTALDIATVAHFLASPAASFISGTDVRVDGGATSAMRLTAAAQ